MVSPKRQDGTYERTSETIYIWCPNLKIEAVFRQSYWVTFQTWSLKFRFWVPSLKSWISTVMNSLIEKDFCFGPKRFVQKNEVFLC